MPLRCVLGHDWRGCRCCRPGCGARRNAEHAWIGHICGKCGIQVDLLNAEHVRTLQEQGFVIERNVTIYETLEARPCEAYGDCWGRCSACQEGPVPVTHIRTTIELLKDGVPIVTQTVEA